MIYSGVISLHDIPAGRDLTCAFIKCGRVGSSSWSSVTSNQLDAKGILSSQRAIGNTNDFQVRLFMKRSS